MALPRFSDLLTLKDYLGKTTAKQDLVLDKLLVGVSAFFIRYTQQLFVVKERTQLFHVDHRRGFSLPGAPVHSILELNNDPERLFTTTSIVLPTNYDAETDRDTGLVFVDKVGLSSGRGALKVRYIGGFSFDRDEYLSVVNDPASITAPVVGQVYLVGSSPVAAFSSNPEELVTVTGIGPVTWSFQDAYSKARETHPDLEEATLIQVGYLFRTRQWQGTQQATFKSSSVMVRSRDFAAPAELLINQFRRIRTVNI